MRRLSHLLFALGIVTFWLPVQGQVDSTAKPLSILEYGLHPDYEYQDALETVAERWQIEFVTVAGCLVSKHLRDSVKVHNEYVQSLLENRHGADWRFRFDAEVDAQLQADQKARNIVHAQPYFQTLDSALRAIGNRPYLFLIENEDGHSYTTTVCGWGEWEDETIFVNYYILNVDMRNSTVKIVSDEIEPNTTIE